jgi:hypothetical protein
LKNKNLPIYGVKNKRLKDYLTSERDLMRGQTKVPLKFRLWERDIDQDEYRNNGSFIATSNFDTEYYNLHQGFMGSNKKLDKYNQKEKLEKEEKNMEDSTAKLIAGNDKQEPAKLQDFKIIKVIDKGSFGKVYLVANRHTG